MPPIRVLTVDDDERFLDAVAAMLETIDDIEIVGRAVNGEQGVQRARELMPDVITLDLDMPVMTGVEATRMITHFLSIPIVLLTGSADGAMTNAALEAGAIAHVNKARAWGALVPALRAAVGRTRRH